MLSVSSKISGCKNALPYIQKFKGKTFVIKYGGAAMADRSLNMSFANDVALLRDLGIKVIIVHGGGKEISELSGKLNISVKFIDGLRYTDKPTMDVVQMVLAGKTNKSIVSNINKFGGNAVGICGLDANIFKVKKLFKNNQDLGLVGEIVKINAEFINLLLINNFIPVIAPIGYNGSYESFNINADDAASSVACALNAEKLIYVSDVRGIMVKDKLIRSIDIKKAQHLIDEKIIINGMIPKIISAFRSIRSGVKKIHIVDGRIKHSLLSEIFTDKGIGTEIISNLKNKNVKVSSFNKIKFAS